MIQYDILYRLDDQPAQNHTNDNNNNNSNKNNS